MWLNQRKCERLYLLARSALEIAVPAEPDPGDEASTVGALIPTFLARALVDSNPAAGQFASSARNSFSSAGESDSCDWP